MIHRTHIASVAAIVMTVATGTAATRALSPPIEPHVSGTPAESRPMSAGTPMTVYVDEYQDEPIYVDAPAPPTTTSPPPLASSGAALTVATATPTVPSADTAGHEDSDAAQSGDPHSDDDHPAIAPGQLPASTPPSTSTTTTSPHSVPTTTLPRGAEVPSDWPPGTPYPPIPPGCHHPHLEDNGVWNCEH